jgi:hypothetical protein
MSLANEPVPAAFFVRDGDDFVPTWIAQGPWGSTVSGNVVGGILAWAIERDAADHELQPARLTVDLLRPTALEPLRVQTVVSRQGRRIRLVDAQLTQKDSVVARASALFLGRSEQPPDEVWSSPIAMPPLPAEPEDLPDGAHTDRAHTDRAHMFFWSYGRDPVAGSPGIGMTEWQQADGPKFAWLRETNPVVDGDPLTPFTRAAMAGDVTSSLTHWGTGGLKFINADYTITLSRLPDGPHIGLAALTHYSHAGVATGVATIFDRHGPIGSGMATAIANPGFRPPF